MINNIKEEIIKLKNFANENRLASAILVLTIIFSIATIILSCLIVSKLYEKNDYNVKQEIATNYYLY